MAVMLEQAISAAGLRVGVVVARFNDEITSRLLDGALRALAEAGAKDEHVVVASVPGAWEIPFALTELAKRRLDGGAHFDALVALGAVIRGETAHFEYVAGGAVNGCQAVEREFGIPVANGVLTTENEDQALARAGGAMGNKGAEAALAAVEMANLKRELAARTLG